MTPLKTDALFSEQKSQNAHCPPETREIYTIKKMFNILVQHCIVFPKQLLCNKVVALFNSVLNSFF